MSEELKEPKEIKDLILDLEKYFYKYASEQIDYQKSKDGFNVLFPIYSVELKSRIDNHYKNAEEASNKFESTLKLLEWNVAKLHEALTIKTELINNYENKPDKLEFSEETIVDMMSKILVKCIHFEPTDYQKLKTVISKICADYDIEFGQILALVIKGCMEGELFEKN